MPTAPVLSPSYWDVFPETRRLVDRRHVTLDTTLTWQEMDILVEFLDSIRDRVRDVQAGPYNGSFVPLVHLLKANNVKMDKPLLKLPRAVVPEQMQNQGSGDMRIVISDTIDMATTYSTSRDHGRLVVNGWKVIRDNYYCDEGDKLIVVLHVNNNGPVLFMRTIYKWETSDDDE